MLRRRITVKFPLTGVTIKRRGESEQSSTIDNIRLYYLWLYGPCIFPPTEILTVTRYELRNTARAESEFRNSNPKSKNLKFWILGDADRISELTD